ncbi:hypothetical protein [Nitrosococcus watsonii]|uniref:hypothetical protein n=1 Tax=Nitrosococcus watsonii TaxID=473531 RepID=UPI0002DAF637|nr:hypothetical protein [Nitrosococcus watsonii]
MVFLYYTNIEEDGFIHDQSATPDHIHGSQGRDTALLGDETALYRLQFKENQR